MDDIENELQKLRLDPAFADMTDDQIRQMLLRNVTVTADNNLSSQLSGNVDYGMEPLNPYMSPVENRFDFGNVSNIANTVSQVGTAAKSLTGKSLLGTEGLLGTAGLKGALKGFLPQGTAAAGGAGGAGLAALAPALPFLAVGAFALADKARKRKRKERLEAQEMKEYQERKLQQKQDLIESNKDYYELANKYTNTYGG